MNPNRPEKQDVAELRAAVVALGTQISDLSGALITVNDIQKRQIQTEKTTQAIQETTYTKDEAAIREERLKKETTHRILISIGLFAMVMAAFLGGLYRYQIDQKNAVYKVCVARNIQNQKVYSVLSKRNPHAPPLTEDQKKSLATLQDAFAPLDCEHVKK